MEKEVQKPIWHALTVRLPWEVYERLAEMAAKDERKIATYIRLYLAALATVGEEASKVTQSA